MSSFELKTLSLLEIGMSDIKHVNMSIPAPKKERRSRKARLNGSNGSVSEPVLVPTPTIRVEQQGGSASASAPVDFKMFVETFRHHGVPHTKKNPALK